MDTSIQKYISFVKTAQYLSFTRAAVEMNYSQSGVSRMVGDLEKGAKAEISEIFERNHLVPRVHFTTWDDYTVMSMVESGLGVSILPELILKRIPYHIVVRELDVPAYRDIGLVLKNKETASPAMKQFLAYVNSNEEN